MDSELMSYWYRLTLFLLILSWCVATRLSKKSK